MHKRPSKTKNTVKLIKPEVRRLKAYFVNETPYRIKLDAMESPFSLPADVQQEIAESVKLASINRYPDPSAKELKEAIADLWGIGTQRMILGNGSDELIQTIILAFGGPVLVPVPTFDVYELLSRALSANSVMVPLSRSFALNADVMIRKAKETKAKVIFLACPNNPTGNRFSDEAMLNILEKVNAAVVIDEAYFSFSGKSFLPLLKDYPNMIILRTLSKIGLAGLRIGVLTASAKLIHEFNKIRLPYNINTLSQTAAVVALKHKEVITRQTSLLISARQRLYNALSEMKGLMVYPSETNFILFRTEDDASSVYEKLKESGILVKNMNRPGMLKNCLRVTVGSPEENSEFIQGLKKIYKRPDRTTGRTMISK